MGASLEALLQVEEHEKTHQEAVNLHRKHVVIIVPKSQTELILKMPDLRFSVLVELILRK